MTGPDVAIHYEPGGRPLCGAESWLAVYTDDPDQVSGCDDCLELVAEDVGDTNHYAGRCLHCKEHSAPGLKTVHPPGCYHP